MELKHKKIDCTPIKTSQKDYSELVYWVWMYFGAIVYASLCLLIAQPYLWRPCL